MSLPRPVGSGSLPNSRRMPDLHGRSSRRCSGNYERLSTLPARRAPEPGSKTSGQPAFSVVGSIVLPMGVTFVAGKPLISACLWMMASSFAR